MSTDPSVESSGEARLPSPKPLRIKIGSQREHDNTGSPPAESTEEPRPQVTAENAPTSEEVATTPIISPDRGTEAAPAGGEPPRKFPPPRLEQTSEDLEDEIAAALGEVSVDDILSGDSGGDVKSAELELDSRHSAIVVKVHRDNIFFSLPGHHEGVASAKQMTDPPEPGTRMEVVVRRFDAEEGLYELAIAGTSVAVADWSDLSEGMVVDARITGHNSGGLECDVNGIRGFIPASQVSLYRVDDFSDFVDQKLPCVVTEANPARRNLVLSHRAVLEREREEARQKLLDSLEVGQTREGVVRSIRDFGAFVDLGGVDGLVHISQLSWDRVGHPSDILEEGQPVKVKIDKIDRNTGKIGLSYRDLLAHPWDDVETKFPLHTIVKGTVSRITDFGAFVRLGPGVEGLVHISELAHHRVHKVQHVVQEGQEVEVKVLSIDRDAQRMSLSMKAAQAAPHETDEDAEASEESSVEAKDTAATKEPAAASRKVPLKGGTDRRSGGESFGLNW